MLFSLEYRPKWKGPRLNELVDDTSLHANGIAYDVYKHIVQTLVMAVNAVSFTR